MQTVTVRVHILEWSTLLAKTWSMFNLNGRYMDPCGKVVAAESGRMWAATEMLTLRSGANYFCCGYACMDVVTTRAILRVKEASAT